MTYSIIYSRETCCLSCSSQQLARIESLSLSVSHPWTISISELSTLHGSLLTATRKPILHDLSLFYALQKYFLKSSAIAPLTVSVESCVQLQLWREKEQFSSGWMATFRWPPTCATPRDVERAHAQFLSCTCAMHVHPGRSCDSFNQLAKKLVSRLAASFAKPLKD